MTFKTLTKQSVSSAFPKEFLKLQDDVSALRSLLISWVGMDTEGEYRPEFVERVLRIAREKPTETFKNGASFLARLRKV